MSNFKVGDEVMCIDATDCIPRLKAGELYVIADMFLCDYCGTSVELRGIEMHFFAARFIKLDGLTESDSVYGEKKVTA